MKNYKLVLEYDGTDYHGFQIQVREVTIQSWLERALGMLAQEPIRVFGASRTDAGVHALGQVVHFFANLTVPDQRLPQALNSILPPDIRVKSAVSVNDQFHARYDVTWKTYVYRIYQAPISSVFHRRYALWVKQPLDWDKMVIASKDLIGTHDFLAFTSSKSRVKSTVRSISDCSLTFNQSVAEFRYTADGFLYNMVRNIMGTLIDVGLDKRPVYCMKEILLSQDRRCAGVTAPAHGLCLESISYD